MISWGISPHPPYVGDYHHPRTRHPVLNQPVEWNDRGILNTQCVITSPFNFQPPFWNQSKAWLKVGLPVGQLCFSVEFIIEKPLLGRNPFWFLGKIHAILSYFVGEINIISILCSYFEGEITMKSPWRCIEFHQFTSFGGKKTLPFWLCHPLQEGNLDLRQQLRKKFALQLLESLPVLIMPWLVMARSGIILKWWKKCPW